MHPNTYSETDFIAPVEQCLTDLQIDTADVLLLHWPPGDGRIEPPLRLLQQARDSGLAGNIGVSKSTVQMMRDAVTIVDAPIWAPEWD